LTRRRTAVVTGATSGIGFATARALAAAGDRVVLTARSREKGDAAMARLRDEAPGASLDLAVVDFSSLDSIRACGADLAARFERLDVLVNNAGTWSTARRITPDGLELTWATNQIGYFLLTEILRPALERAAPSRVVVVASDLAYGLDLSDLAFERRAYSGVAAYAQSKQANRMWTRALARRLRGSGVSANSMHPGGVNTALFAKGGGWQAALAGVYGRVAGRSPEKGAETVVWLASSADVEGRTGGFYVDRAERPCRFDDAAHEELLWETCASTARPRA
jgi:NAD(P)-dependent dehydrogenase (short-subunit alcohol dehydrogenase family)